MKFRNAFLALAAVFAFASAPAARAAVDTTNTAVALIDMQYGFYERGGTTNTPELHALVARQVELLAWAVKNNVPVVVFEYEYFRDTDSVLMAPLKAKAGFPYAVITKDEDGAFYSSMSRDTANKFLSAHGIKNLIVAGINGCCCVHDTAEGAIGEGYHVITSSDIVGNINYNPPTYPNNTWFYTNGDLEIRDNLEAIIN